MTGAQNLAKAPLTFAPHVLVYTYFMSARKFSTPGLVTSSVNAEARQARLSLSHEAVLIHKNGIEFRSPTAFNAWTEMTVELRTPDNGRVNCTGVIVSATGNKHTGYQISMIFTDMSRQAQARLQQMSAARLA